MADHSVPRVLSPPHALLGEGPVWVARDRALWWVDIKAPAILRWSAVDGVMRWTPPMRVSAIAPAARGGFIAATDHGLCWADPVEGRYELIAAPERHLPGNRSNDGKVDRVGRFWMGTMDDREEQATGSLYRLDPDLGWRQVDSGYRVTNGPAFSPDGRTLYHTDSALRTIYAFDLADDGTPCHRHALARFKDEDGYPDGMTVDAGACLWVAFWDGWCMRRLSPDGEVLRTVEMPVARPTSCAFGGAALDRLFVTSARIGLNEKALAVQPLAGALFMLDVGVRGLPERPFG